MRLGASMLRALWHLFCEDSTSSASELEDIEGQVRDEHVGEELAAPGIAFG